MRKWRRASAPLRWRGRSSRSPQSEILRRHPSLAFQEGGYQWRIVRDGDRSVMTVTGKGETITAPLLWAFGRGQAGQTYVFERDGALYESRVSFYNALNGLDLTMGAQTEPAAGTSTTPPDAAWTTSARAIVSAATRRARSPAAACTWNRSAPGVGCESCHGAARAARGRRTRRKSGSGEDAEACRSHRRRDGGTLRTLPPHVVADRAEWPSRRAQRPLPTLPPDQQQMLRHGRRAHRLHGLPRSARCARDQRGRLRCQVCRLPFRGAAHQNLPRREGRTA